MYSGCKQMCKYIEHKWKIFLTLEEIKICKKKRMKQITDNWVGTGGIRMGLRERGEKNGAKCQ